MRICVALLLPVVCWGPLPVLAADPAKVQFLRDVRPILSNYCFRCHGPDAESREADLRLDTREGLYGDSSSGQPIVMKGKSGESEVYRRLTAADADERMPPPDAPKHLTAQQIEILRQWIDQGASWETHWAYAPPKRPEVPAVADTDGCRNEVDHFIQFRLSQEGLAASDEADPVTLVRRLSFDLTGLPPSPELVSAYAAAPSDVAYNALVEQLLASPHYGERMAVYWLDLVRYADSCGYHSDVDQAISPYRDYVIAAFNDNLSFAQFTREQLAGDLLPGPSQAALIATGYNRLNKTTEEGGAQAGEYLAKSAADRVRTTAGVWLGSTLGCAECHDHKYDPFTTRDFYSFAAFFADVQEKGVYSGGGRAPEMLLPTPEQRAQQSQINARIADLEVRRWLVGPDHDAQRDQIDAALKAARADREKLERTFARTMITVSVKPREMRILPRGNWLDNTGAPVEPALPIFLAATADTDRRLTRLDLAEWLVDGQNPLTARVFVNRMWKTFFGVGLTKSLDDFGAQGDAPSHPALLDWLAIDFQENGWDVKRLVRLLVSSLTYRQTSIPRPELVERDPQNRLFARQSRWRLEAEFVRDQALATSGLLVRTIGGPSVKPYQPEGYWEFLNFPKRNWVAEQGPNQYRRGLYTHWQRTFLHPSLLAFDAPSREECTAERAISNTPKAALTLLNDPSFVECAKALAICALNEGGSDDAARIAWIWQQATSRLPSDSEAAVLADLLTSARSQFDADQASAQRLLSVGQLPGPDDIKAAELAAWTEVSRAVLNVYECVSRN